MVKRNAAGKALVIVESPAKAKTINKYLGDDYVVKASLGHVRDLPQKQFGIDVSNDFQPTYEVLHSRVKVVNELKKLAAGAQEVFLATDLDREGEAIAWHLVEALNVPADRVRRVIFNEITRSAITEAFAHPHRIDLDRVNAQQARRILDRIVGYELSPLLWRKIAKGLSAGRVQSVAVRLIVDREREIRAFVPEEYWVVAPVFAADGPRAPELNAQWQEFLADQRFASNGPTAAQRLAWLAEHKCFYADLTELPEGKPFRPTGRLGKRADGAWVFTSASDEAVKAAGILGCRAEVRARQPRLEYPHFNQVTIDLQSDLEYNHAPPFAVESVETKRRIVKPPAPFTTASLQQTASATLRFQASRTMRVAQSLYEGVDLNGEGPVGLITYMRTDSTNLSNEAVTAVRDFIQREYGPAYVPQKPLVYGKRQERAQEAHEAIRPSDPHRTPASIRGALSDEQFKLYDLIWKRFVACQVTPAEWDTTNARIVGDTAMGKAVFKASGRILVFDGFYKATGIPEGDQILPELTEAQRVGPIELVPEQKYTNPPPRYTEASLVKALEAEGIGRPSTYATIIDTIQARGYVEQDDRKFFASALGELVTDKLVQHFPKIMDVKFTSHMEDELDKIEEAHLDWVRVLHEFYDPFRDLLEKAGDAMETVRGQPSDHVCPSCGAPLVYRWSKTGRFLACSSYPKCKGALRVDRDGQPVRPKISTHPCELCGQPMVVRQSKTGHFLGCSAYPQCRQTVACNPAGEPLRLVTEDELKRRCDACGTGEMVVKRKGHRAFLGCNRFPECRNTASLPEDVRLQRKATAPPEQAGVNCEKCGRPMVLRSGRRGKFVACSGYPRCRQTMPLERLADAKAHASQAPPADAAATRVAESLPDRETRPDSHAGEAHPATSDESGASGTRGNGRPWQPGEGAPAGFALTRTGRPVVETMPVAGTLRCPECGSTMELKRGRFGPFFSCINFPRCKFNSNLRGEAKRQAEEMMPAPAKPKPIQTEIRCDECGRPMLIREGRRGKFLGCSAYPKCKGTKPLPTGLELEKAAAS